MILSLSFNWSLKVNPISVYSTTLISTFEIQATLIRLNVCSLRKGWKYILSQDLVYLTPGS